MMAYTGGPILISLLIRSALTKATSYAEGQASLPPKVGPAAPDLEDFADLADSLTAIHAVVESAEEMQETDPAIRLWMQKLRDAVYDAVDLLDEVDYFVLQDKGDEQENEIQSHEVECVVTENYGYEIEQEGEIQSHGVQCVVTENYGYGIEQEDEVQRHGSHKEIDIQNQKPLEEVQASDTLDCGRPKEGDHQIRISKKWQGRRWGSSLRTMVNDIVKVVRNPKPKEQVHTSFSPSSNLTTDLDQEEVNYSDRFDQVIKSLDETRKDLNFIELIIQFGKKNIETARPRRSYEKFYLLDDSKFFERGNDVSKVVDSMVRLRSQSPISGISLVGMAGIGKTEVARLTYMKAKNEKLYDVVAWVSASEDFNDERILKELLEYCADIGANGEITADIDLLLNLARNLEKKTFLLILDDLWELDRNKWNDFAGHLSKVVDLTDGGRCSIVLTTQDYRVDYMAKQKFPMRMYDMKRLSDDGCWSIIVDEFLKLSSETCIEADMEDNVKEIAKQCRGLPLAAVIMGETLCRQIQMHKRLAIRDSKPSWLLNSEDGNKILSALKTSSFDRLSCPLKMCFSFCSIFPKGHEIEKDDLVQLWIAQGFVHQLNGSTETLEDVGNGYLSDLVSNYFLKVVQKGYISFCKMDDMMHDLAVFVSKGETLILDAGFSIDENASIKHLAVQNVYREFTRPNVPRGVVQKLRTLFLTNDCGDLISLAQSRSLRCLAVRGSTTSEELDRQAWELLAEALNNMKYLKYLDISRGEMQALNGLSKLYMLRVLSISNCHALSSLPNGLSYCTSLQKLKLCYCRSLVSIPSVHGLSSLKRFELTECDVLRYLPTGLGSCTSLQKLIISRCKSLISIPDEDWKMPCLHFLEISYCENLRTIPDKCVGSLTSLKVLVTGPFCEELEEFPGLAFVYHLNSSLDSLNIVGWPNVASLPPQLAQLTALKRLLIWRFHGVELPEWLGNFSSLETLSLLKCPELTTIPYRLSFCTSLQRLIIQRCNSLYSIPEDIGTLPSLLSLEISECENLESVPEELLGRLTSLTELTLGPFWSELVEFPGLTSIHHVQASLKKLTIGGWPYLKSLPLQLAQLTALEKLVIWRFNGVEVLPDWLGKLSSLRRLIIKECHSLMQLPSHEAMKRLSKLKYLEISNCDKYEGIDTNGTGPESYKVSHIANVSVK